MGGNCGPSETCCKLIRHNYPDMKLKLTRWFDEPAGFKHSSALMASLRFFFAALVCGAALEATAQDTNNANARPTGSSHTNAQLAGTQPQQNRQTRVLSLTDAIQLALEQNLDIQIARLNPLTNGYAIDIAYGVYEPTFNFTAAKSYTDRPGGINPETGQEFGSSVDEANSYTPEIKGMLPTGLTYDLTGNMSRNSILDNTNTGPHWFPPNWVSEPGPGITLDQPLLRNSWIDIDRLNIQIAKANLKISEQALRLQIMQTVTAVMTNYYSLLYARGNVDAQATALKLAQQLVTENLKRVEVGTLAPLDEKQSESQAAASLAALQAAQQALIVQENTAQDPAHRNYSDWAEITPIPVRTTHGGAARAELAGKLAARP